MKYKTNGKEVRVYKNLPEGWSVIKGTMTQPKGTVWIKKGSLFKKDGKSGEYRKNKDYKQALLITDEEQMIETIAENRKNKRRPDNFVPDQTTEKKIRAEMRRQDRERQKREKKSSVSKSTKHSTPLEKSIKPTTDKVGDVLVNQAGVKYKIVGEKYVEPSGYRDGKTKVRHLIVKPDGKEAFEINDHTLKFYRDQKTLKRVAPKKCAAKARKK